MIVVDAAGISDVGRTRKGNEDSIFYDDDMGLYVVADGMGGHNAGEVASKIVADTFRDQMKRFADNLDEDRLRDDDTDLPLKARHLNATIHIANRSVFDQAQANKDQKGMGSTLSAIYLTDSSMIVGNVGDSPIYLIRDGEIELISVLHTMMAEYEAMAPGGSKALAEQFRHMITRAMGIDATVKPDVSERECRKNDTVVISSDGLTDMVEPEKIREIAAEGTAEKACRALVDLANERGGKDNITVIVLKIVEMSDSAAAPAPEAAKPAAKKPETERSEAKKAEAKKKAKPFRLHVNIDTDDASFSAYILRIDDQGAFVETSDPFAVGSEISLTVADPDGKNPFMVFCTVSKRRSIGIEVTFDNPPEKKKTMIEALRKKL